MSGLYTRLCSGLAFPLHEAMKGHSSVAVRRRLEASQWWSAERIEADRVQRLREFLTDIGSSVPRFRSLFAEIGFDPRAVQSIADLRKLPLTTKADMRAHTEALEAEGHGPLTRYNTGGSSGEPLVFHIGRDRKSHDVAAKWRATRWWGVDIGDREAVVWGSPIEHGTQDRIRAWRDRALRTELLPAFEMSEVKLDGFIAALLRQRPRMLFGYPSALAHIARHAKARGIRMNDLGIAVAFVTSERLYDEQRVLIGEVFGCRVANGYGGRDAGFIAHECPSGSMHISAEDIVVELIDAAGEPVTPGQSGEIVVTHLATRDYPFVRARTGDIGVMDGAACACGRGLPRLSEIQGRSTDFVVADDGTVMHGLSLIYVIRDLAGVKSFKVTQETRRLTRVELVTEAEFDPNAVQAIVVGFKRRLGAAVEVQVQLVPSIAPEKSGKYRYIVSHALAAAH